MSRSLKFSNGGCVVHGIIGDWVGKISAWFNDKGDLLDAEQIFIGRRCGGRPIKRGGPIWNWLSNQGESYLKIAK